MEVEILNLVIRLTAESPSWNGWS